MAKNDLWKSDEASHQFEDISKRNKQSDKHLVNSIDIYINQLEKRIHVCVCVRFFRFHFHRTFLGHFN